MHMRGLSSSPTLYPVLDWMVMRHLPPGPTHIIDTHLVIPRRQHQRCGARPVGRVPRRVLPPAVDGVEERGVFGQEGLDLMNKWSIAID